jgi:hypothetical protein
MTKLGEITSKLLAGTYTRVTIRDKAKIKNKKWIKSLSNVNNEELIDKCKCSHFP